MSEHAVTEATGTCGLCADAGTPVRVLAVKGTSAQVESEDGCAMEVAIDFVPRVDEGEILLVHAGVAIARLPRATPIPRANQGSSPR